MFSVNKYLLFDSSIQINKFGENVIDFPPIFNELFSFIIFISFEFKISVLYNSKDI